MNKAYSRSKLVNYIVESINSGANINKLSKEVAAFLVDAGKISELDSIMRDARELRAAKFGVVELDVRSAHDIDATTIKEIEKVAKSQYPTTKKVNLNKIHDDSVVAGAILSFPHASFDVTVKTKLNKLREAIS